VHGAAPHKKKSQKMVVKGVKKREACGIKRPGSGEKKEPVSWGTIKD